MSTPSALVPMRAFLLSQSSITDIVGQRVYYRSLPQNCVMPALTYWRGDIKYEYQMGGPVDAVTVDVHFAAHGEAGSQPHELIAALDALFDGTTAMAIPGASVRQTLLKPGGKDQHDEYDAELQIYKVFSVVQILYTATD